MLRKIEEIIFFLRKGNNLEQKFSAFQGYASPSILEWKRQTGLSLSLIIKMLRHFDLVTGARVREIIRTVVISNPHIFDQPDCYVLGFGPVGKSGDLMRYEFRHTAGMNPLLLTESWRIRELPPNSKLVFIDDVIGTGRQSVKYIQRTLSQLLLPSQEPYLFSLYATLEGIENLTENTSFQVLYGTLLEENRHYFYSAANSFFSPTEKAMLIKLNERLADPNPEANFDLGLLLGFNFAIPNNTMPIFWKENWRYVDNNGQDRLWRALLPRRY